ncbi:hypothetical protein DFH06DRAFT_1480747 [Mycena polygramma]|nr:hypothetical protein DFH06DRAFT_1480747 [Mycena polygramma]
MGRGASDAVADTASANRLESVTIFKRRARVTSVSLPLDEQTETETETDTDALTRWAGAIGSSAERTMWAPRKSSLNLPPKRPLTDGKWGYTLMALDAPRTPDTDSMVLLETMRLVGAGANPPSSLSPWTPDETIVDGDGPLALTGTILARNVAFEKHVAVHAGQLAHHDIPLAHYGGIDWLSERELMLAVRFTVPWVCAGTVAPYVYCEPTSWRGTGAGGAGEWWDNNSGRNYRAGFHWVYTPPGREVCASTIRTARTILSRNLDAEESITFPLVDERVSESPPPLDSITEVGRDMSVVAPLAESTNTATPLPSHSTAPYHACLMQWCFGGDGENTENKAPFEPELRQQGLPV